MALLDQSKTFDLWGIEFTSIEIKFLCAVGIGLLAITSVPYLYGYLTAPADQWFSGVIYNVHDTAQYFSWMRESGHALFIENKANEALEKMDEAIDKAFGSGGGQQQ